VSRLPRRLIGTISEELDKMEIDRPTGALKDSNKSWNESSRARKKTPILNPTYSYPTPGSDSLVTPILVKERIESYTSFSLSEAAKQKVLLLCSLASPTDNSTYGNIGSATNASKLASTR